MLARLEERAAPPGEGELSRARHALLVLPKAAGWPALAGIPGLAVLRAALARRGKKPGELATSPVATDLPGGTLAAWVMFDPARPAFEQHTALRKALALVLAEKPAQLTIGLFGPPAERARAAAPALYAAWVNGAALPERKKKPEGRPLRRIRLYGHVARDGFARERAVAAGNLLARELTTLPPNELTPAAYRARVRRLAAGRGWRYREYGIARLRRMGAGAFVAVAQGSGGADAAIVRVAWRARNARTRVALVGKGICFDTGGHNLKSARHMHGMHEDMNGSAVALGVLLAASELRLPLEIECWMAIARNDLSPRAYRPNDVVRALDGTTIEVVHTDAEGRLVLADTLALAARSRPDLVVDFATLTGSMQTALGERYSGVFATSEELARRALAAGTASGERVCLFPLDEDYDEALESRIADVKQCALEGRADHILAARFLRRFVGDRPWLHMDLSSSSCKGGLGAVASEVTGFGVGWAIELLRSGPRSNGEGAKR